MYENFCRILKPVAKSGVYDKSKVVRLVVEPLLEIRKPVWKHLKNIYIYHKGFFEKLSYFTKKFNLYKYSMYRKANEDGSNCLPSLEEIRKFVYCNCHRNPNSSGHLQ